MIFDKSTIIDGVKLALDPVDRSRSKDIELAMGLALDDLSTRLISKGFLSSYNLPLTVGEREFIIEGQGQDLNFIFLMKYTSGGYEAWLEYKGQEQFIRQDDIALDGQSGQPSVWTVYGSSDGFPTIKLDRPAQGSASLTVLYFPNYTPDNVAQARSASAIVSGTVAYFFGIDNVKGQNYYTAFKEGTKRMRAADDFRAKPTSKIVPSKDDEEINEIRWNIRGRRM